MKPSSPRASSSFEGRPSPSSAETSSLPERATSAFVVILLAFAVAACAPDGPEGADLVLTGGEVWTGDDARPVAEAVAVEGNRIVAVGSVGEVAEHRGPETRVVELDGRFVSPGFIDNHTHFNRAGELLLGVNLLDVADEEALIQEVRAGRDRLPEGSWIEGGMWGAYEAWEMGDAGEVEARDREPFRPHRAMIDSLTPRHPALLSRWDRSLFLANSRALEAAGADCSWSGVECGDGEPTGRVSPEAAERIQEVIPPKSMDLRLAEARAALEDLRRFGVTTIHDNTPPTQFAVYDRLYQDGELTVRVYARPTLEKYQDLATVGIPRSFGDEWVKIGGLKGFVDGIMGNSTARFYEPFEHVDSRGQWRRMMTEPPGMLPLLMGADSAGYWPQVHAIGDQAIDTLLTMFEVVVERNEPRDRRFRVIHAQHLRGPEVAERMARLGVIAEVQPYHAIDDMRWMEERIGDRIRWTYAFRTLDDAGVRLSFGSDWPGTNAAWYTANPLMGMYAAVTRQTLEGEPEGGWVPQERIDAETALRAYTVNNAYAAGEEEFKGRIAPGYLADLAVLDRNPLEVEPGQLKEIQVDLTVLDGRVVHER